jgi:hypothetical protein
MTRIDPFELWNDFRTWVNTQQGGFMPPQSVFIRVANIASLELWKKWTRQAEKSQEIRDYLLPFLVSKNCIVTQSNSYYSTFSLEKIKDYGRFASAKILLVDEKTTVPSKDVDKGKCCNGKFVPPENLDSEYDKIREQEVDLIDNQRWSAVLQHLRKKPTFEKPKMTEINGGFQIAPREVGVVVLNYYTEPKDAVFAYTQAPGNLQTGSGGAIQYDPNNSVPFQWSKNVKVDLLEAIKDTYISFTRDGLFQQISSAQKQK